MTGAATFGPARHQQVPAGASPDAARSALADRAGPATERQATLAAELRPAQYTALRGGYQLVWLPDRAPNASG
jgi:hypothetical protein